MARRAWLKALPFVLFLTAFVPAVPAIAQTGASRTEPDVPEKKGKEIRAFSVGERAPRIDGKLDNEIWTTAQRVDDLVQNDPDNMAAPLERTVIQVAYDDRSRAVHVFQRGPRAARHPEGLLECRRHCHGGGSRKRLGCLHRRHRLLDPVGQEQIHLEWTLDRHARPGKRRGQKPITSTAISRTRTSASFRGATTRPPRFSGSTTSSRIRARRTAASTCSLADPVRGTATAFCSTTAGTPAATSSS